MNDPLVIYYQHNVVAAYDDYRTTRRNNAYKVLYDHRKALTAASALFHFREHLPDALTLTRREAEAACADYGLLADTVNAAKHCTIKKVTPHGPPIVSSFDSIFERNIVIQYVDTEGEYSAWIKVVGLTLNTGGERDILDVLTNVINFWEEYLWTKGILASKRVFTVEDPYRKRTREECHGMHPELQITQGLPANLPFQFMRFDDSLNRAVPIDLTGAEVVFRVFEPKPVEYTIAATRKTDGVLVERKVMLTREEVVELSKRVSEKAKNEFLQGLPTVKRALVELSTELSAKPYKTKTINL